jgi:hypothetical protein
MPRGRCVVKAGQSRGLMRGRGRAVDVAGLERKKSTSRPKEGVGTGGRDGERLVVWAGKDGDRPCTGEREWLERMAERGALVRVWVS